MASVCGNLGEPPNPPYSGSYADFTAASTSSTRPALSEPALRATPDAARLRDSSARVAISVWFWLKYSAIFASALAIWSGGM